MGLFQPIGCFLYQVETVLDPVMGTERTALKWLDLIVPTLEEIDDIIESFAIERKLFTVYPLYHAIRAK